MVDCDIKNEHTENNLLAVKRMEMTMVRVYLQCNKAVSK